ncbi:HAD-IA family hydrolase [Thermoleophilia bacterium SCSIO 60948]|nr:HAD-IA family hydrolase [Thermoleophilia bacterium SCSIO 60948]
MSTGAGVIFDCDGVLVDSEPLSAAAMAETMREAGIEATTEDAVREFTGLSLKSAMARSEEMLGAPLPEDFAPSYRSRLYAAFDAELEAVAGVAGAIATLESRGIATCVASSGEHERIRRALTLTGLHERFEGRIYSATEVEHGKPAPDLFLHAARSEGWDRQRCVVVEDSTAGAAAGRAAGMRVLGYAERTPADALAAEGAEPFSSMHELPKLVAARLG